MELKVRKDGADLIQRVGASVALAACSGRAPGWIGTFVRQAGRRGLGALLGNSVPIEVLQGVIRL